MTPLFRLALLLPAAALALAACAEFPELDGRVTPAAAAAPYPDLVPLPPLLAAADALGAAPDLSAPARAAADTRAAELRARAAALRPPVVDPDARARLAAGVDTSALDAVAGQSLGPDLPAADPAARDAPLN
ncbi:hypothetical protein [Oceanicola granulosus]|nr:hypothetical protein [Oceanicola granulosus]